jgi:dTDP-4-amino-4,6-dideoxygalactose transaminase
MIMFSLFVIRTKNRQNFKIICRKRHQNMIHYPVPPHKQITGYNPFIFSITEQIHHEVLSLPMSPVYQ